MYFLKPILKSICMYPESNMSSLVNGFLFMRLKKKEVSRVSEIIDELSIKELEAINKLIEYVASNANVSDIRIEYTKSLDRIRSMN